MRCARPWVFYSSTEHAFVVMTSQLTRQEERHKASGDGGQFEVPTDQDQRWRRRMGKIDSWS